METRKQGGRGEEEEERESEKERERESLADLIKQKYKEHHVYIICHLCRP